MASYRNTIVISLFAASALAACGGAQASDQSYQASSYGHGEEQIIGSGRIVTRDFAVADAARLSVDGPVNVVIRQGAEPSLVVSAEDNIMDLVTARVEGGELSLATKGSFRTRKGISAVLTVPSLDTVSINSSGDVRLEEWNASDLELVIGGSGDIELSGDVERVTSMISGSGDIDLTRTRSDYVDADIEGSGIIRTGSTRKLDATVNGSGLIDAGDVGELDAQLNGSGEIIYRTARQVVREERNGTGRISRR